MAIAKLNNVIYEDKDYTYIPAGTEVNDERITIHSDSWLERVYGIVSKPKKSNKSTKIVSE